MLGAHPILHVSRIKVNSTPLIVIRNIKTKSVIKNYYSTTKWWHLATNYDVLLLFIFVYKIQVSQTAKQWKNRNMKTKHGTHSSESDVSSVTLITLIPYFQHTNYIWKPIWSTLLTPFTTYTHYQITLSKFVYLSNDAQEFCFKRNIKIYLKNALMCFSLITIIRERAIWALLKVLLLKQSES
jgi:hypothetical protein